ncbi:protein Dok-7-like [Gouania willdenowi]|uniref:Protein Dok-7-like n=1 Tax=Gouania willdenowi TaxID=441366 RepID=A0A8C5GR16_GOUWI|nr:protein Dok-7-like [Gouania willdenowi]
MTDSVVVEGYARLREGKKWKTRWIVLRKPSPVADCLLLLVFKDKSEKAQGTKERASVTLEEICGLEAGQWYEGVTFTLFILCLNQAALLGFDSRDVLQVWDARLRYSLGEVHRFAVGVLPGTKLESGPATLHLCNNLLALARDLPPAIIGHWNLPDLRRYGPVPNGFVFEGGTRCGYWAGVFLLASADSEQISFLFDCIVRGISPTRGPFGLRPVLPDPSGSQTNYEEKLNHEAQELEKRLSMLSHGSSTASSTSYSPCVGGDDRSISGSSDTSDTSQSDCSIGSRLTIWAEPVANAPEVVNHVGGKVELLISEKAAGSRPVAKPPRQLQEIGRQSSSDSGIATGSHSSYSGSFSSYTGSLDNHSSGEDFGSVISLPPHLVQELSPCICPTVAGHEYQVPTSLRYLYDTPRSVRQETSESVMQNEPSSSSKDSLAPLGLTGESIKGNKANDEGQSEAPEKASSSLTNVPKTIVTICSVCGGFKGTSLKVTNSSLVPAIPDKRLHIKEERCKVDPAYEVMESLVLERSPEMEEKKYELMGSYNQQRLLSETEENPFPERPRTEGVTYVNIPVSPTSKKQVNYMELELQEPGHCSRGPAAHQRKSSTKYAHIDITATETAHKVGTQHALGRQEGLHALELRRKATPH